ncbi:MAG TPA: sigma-70 family RNA polymerase sigma factor [Thermoleophilia bacterium]|nr:sigma-70 family RNA polymerase sigma factor [Thermoleophilia bacterium]
MQVGKSVSDDRGVAGTTMPVPEPDDERLIADLRRRAPDALARLHRRYAVGIYNLALRMVHHRQDAEDITHDVLIRAYERLPRDRDVRLRPWLYRVTLNRCYDHMRASARRRPADPEHQTVEVVAAGDPFERAELGALFERTLETLSARQQAALLLKDVHGCSTAELAVMLQVTPGSAEVLLARARTSFRARFATIAGVEPRAVPTWIGASLVLPLVALPAALAAPPAPPPAAPLHPLPDLTHAAGGGYAAPAGVAGGGLGPAVANSAALKLAAVLAAAMTMTTGVSDMHHRPYHQHPAAKAVAHVAAHVAAPVTRVGTAAKAARSTPRPGARPAAAGSPGATPPAVAVATTSPAPAPSPSASDTRLGDAAPTPSPSVSPTETSSPTPVPSDSATPQPTPSPSTSDAPAPSPTTSDTPASSPAPSG